jgi:hypothetical protein
MYMLVYMYVYTYIYMYICIYRAAGEIKEQRPAALRHAHVQAHRNRSIKNLGGLNPDELDILYNQNNYGEEDYFAQVGIYLYMCIYVYIYMIIYM